MTTTKRTFYFGTTEVIQEVRLYEDGYMHRLIIGTITSEWASFHFPAHLVLGNRTFVSIIDGRTIFPTVFEVIGGLEKV